MNSCALWGHMCSYYHQISKRSWFGGMRSYKFMCVFFLHNDGSLLSGFFCISQDTFWWSHMQWSILIVTHNNNYGMYEREKRAESSRGKTKSPRPIPSRFNLLSPTIFLLSKGRPLSNDDHHPHQFLLQKCLHRHTKSRTPSPDDPSAKGARSSSQMENCVSSRQHIQK